MVEEGLVDAYISVQFIGMPRCLKKHDTLSLVRTSEFRYDLSHAIRGWIYFFKNKGLSKLIDQGHIHLPLPDHNVSFEACVNMRTNCWFKIGIRRQSLELVNTKVCNSSDMFRVFLNIHYGGFVMQEHIYRDVFDKWKKSKQFLFEEAAKAESNGLIPPSSVIKLDLFEHQKQALRWMVDWEEYQFDELPPFWEEINSVYRMLHSSFLTLIKPQRIKGGILADESGMGKKCTLISLIAYTKQKYYDTASGHVGNAHKVVDVNFEWKPTLVVCHPDALTTWKCQIEQFTWPGSLSVCTYLGWNNDPDHLRQHDIVLSPYNVVMKQDSSSLIYQIEWWRVIFDEAHVIESTTTLPLVNLKAMRRWAVTGKPIDKDYENYELYSIMKCLHLNQEHYVEVILQTEVLMGIFSLKRTMPRKPVENHMVILSKVEQDSYNVMEVNAKAQANDSENDRLNNDRPILAAVLNLWYCCNSLYLYRLSCVEKVSKFNDLRSVPKLLKKWVMVLKEEKDYACPICLDKPEDMIITRCTHIFCRSCIFRACKDRKSKCPICRTSLTKCGIYSIQREPSYEEKIKSLTTQASSPANRSSKISALLNLLVELRNREPSRKSVVLSQFQGMLHLVAEVLLASGFSVMHINVSRTAKENYKTVEEYKITTTPVVLLTTFKFLGIGRLDLSDAYPNVYMLEPCWNDLIEEEAVRHTQCFGKRNDGNVVRFVCKNSIEERVLEVRNHQDYANLNSKEEVSFTCINNNCRWILRLS